MTKGLVSIIMPAFNCADFILHAIHSVEEQSYTNWELLIVDDCSTDNTREVVEEVVKKDFRVKLFKLFQNSGAAISRITALDNANGEYIAFLDSDDVWFPEKLEKQINFMKENDIDFSCTAYDKIDESGNKLNKVINVRRKQNYNDVLKTCPGNSTVIYNIKHIGKVTIPTIRKRNDYVMWLKVIKKANYLHGLDEVLSSHRIRMGSISSNKFSLVKYHWHVYRKIEKLSLMKSTYLIMYWGIVTVLKLR